MLARGDAISHRHGLIVYMSAIAWAYLPAKPVVSAAARCSWLCPLVLH